MNLGLKLIFINIILLLSFSKVAGQNNATHSLHQSIADTTVDSIKYKLYLDLVKEASYENLDSSYSYYQEALKIAKELSSPRKEFKAHVKIGLVFLRKGRYELPKKLFDQALVIAKELDDDYLKSRAYNVVGTWHWEVSDLAQAMENLHQALHYAERSGSVKIIITTYINLALVLGDSGSSEKAITYEEKALQYAKEQNDTIGQTILYNNIATSYLDLGEHEKVLEYVEHALSLLKNRNNQSLLGLVLSKKAMVQFEQGDTESGINLLKEILQQAKENKDPRNQILFSEKLSALFYQTKQYDHAIAVAQEGILVSEQIGKKRELPELCETIAKSYKALNQLPKYIHWLEKCNKTKDDLFKLEQNKEVLAIEAQYKLKEQEAENQLLALKHENQRTIISLLGAIFLIFSLFIYFFFKRQHEKRLEKFRQKIAADLHDDVGSNLNSITRIAKGLKSENNSVQINDGIDSLVVKSNTAIRNIVDVIWAMDNQKSDLGALIRKMEDYLDDLQVHNAEINIDFHKNITNEKQKLQIKTRHHLLMIFKEAINNAIKHTEAKRIEVEFKELEQKLFFNIINYFDVKKSDVDSTNRGVANIRKRILELDGQLNIQEEENKFAIHIELGKG